jgi:hypothetical protein
VRKNLFGLLFLIAAILTQSASAQSQIGRLNMLKASWQFDKKIMLSELMQFDQREANAFWPIYNSYMKDWSRLMNRRIFTVQKYCDDFKNMTAPQVSQFMNDLFVNDTKLNKLHKKTFRKVSRVLSPMRASQFMHLEYAMQLQLMSEMQQRALFVGDLMKKL